MGRMTWTRRKILNAVKYMNKNGGFDVKSNKKCDKGYSGNALYNAARLNQKEFKFEDENEKFIGKRALEELALGKSDSNIYWTREMILKEVKHMHDNDIEFLTADKVEYKPGISPYKVYNRAVLNRKKFKFAKKNGRFIGKRGLELLVMGTSDAMLYGDRDLILSEIQYMAEHNIEFKIDCTKEYKPGISPYKIYSKAMNNAKRFGFVDEFNVFIGKERLVKLALGKTNRLFENSTIYIMLKDMGKIKGLFIGGRLCTPKIFENKSIEEIAEIAKVRPITLERRIEVHVNGKRIHN